MTVIVYLVLTRWNYSWIYKNYHVQKFCESLVCPEQLNCLLFFRKILQVPHNLWFSSLFVYIDAFPKTTIWFLRSIFSQWGQLRDSYGTFTEGSKAHWCSRKKNHALSENFWTQWRCVNISYFAWILYFTFSTALQRLKKIVTYMFPRRQN